MYSGEDGIDSGRSNCDQFQSLNLGVLLVCVLVVFHF